MPTETEKPDSVVIGPGKTNYVFDFKGELSTIDNGTGYTVNLTIINKPDTICYYSVRWQVFTVGIPGFVDVDKDKKYYTESRLKIENGFGGFYVLVIETNNYLIDSWNKDGTWHGSFWITWPDISTTPATSEWEIDWTAKTIKRKS